MNKLLAGLGAALLVATGAVAILEGGEDSGGGSGASASGGGAAKSVNAVSIKDFEYGPPEIKVKLGTKVTWTNDDSTVHTATSRATGSGGSAVFGTDTIREGKRGAVTLTKPGEFDYYCQFHPTMSGKLTVEQ